MSRTLPFVLLDVFTDRPLTGNQLAVFPDARPIDDATMQALARETNFSETTFVLPAEKGGDARMRIFTPNRELPFAGHPTLGTAFVVGAAHGLDLVRLETGMGIIPVRLERAGDHLAFGRMEQPIPRVEAVDPSVRAALLEALGVSESRAPVEVYDIGIRHAFVELDSPADVAALRPHWGRLIPLTEREGLNVYAGAGSRWKLRMFAPGHAVTEDAATGSAAGPLSVHLARHGRIRFGDEIMIEQGVEIGRPSVLHARADGDSSHITKVEVGGHVTRLGEGVIHLRRPS
jgi:trans-2,3-dihydro-3-hydroxyanthranilate isomerase